MYLAHKTPKEESFIVFLPIKNKVIGVRNANKALGNLAKPPMPKIFILKDCNQKKSGGFS